MSEHLTDDEIKRLIVECSAPGIQHPILAHDAAKELAQDALRFRHLRRTVKKNREGLLQADFAVMYPDEWRVNVEDMREMWTAAIDRNMKGKLP